VDMTDSAGKSVGRKDEVLSTIISIKHGTSFHGHSVIMYRCEVENMVAHISEM
jgi:hypothetical protein